ncbi:MAG: peptide deformylase [Rhodobacteraceae bacterium]|nr:peptide deformylase [Paracoccaceae bacterium]
MIREILQWPDPRLRQPAETVAVVTEGIRAIWDDMIDTMEAMQGQGVGLAAPQIGVMQRLAVVDCSKTRDQAIRMANPKSLPHQGHKHPYRGQPLPARGRAPVIRPAEVTVRFMNADGAVEERAFDGLWATSVQHQIDHLAGRMYFDRLSRLRLLKKAEKRRR